MPWHNPWQMNLYRWTCLIRVHETTIINPEVSDGYFTISCRRRCCRHCRVVRFSPGPVGGGEHYERLPTEVSASSDEGIEVVEVFWYGCGACNQFEPLMQAWKKEAADDVNVVLVPAPMNKQAVEHARAYYATKAIDATDKTHDAFYTALAEERQDLTNASTLGILLRLRASTVKRLSRHTIVSG